MVQVLLYPHSIISSNFTCFTFLFLTFVTTCFCHLAYPFFGPLPLSCPLFTGRISLDSSRSFYLDLCIRPALSSTSIARPLSTCSPLVTLLLSFPPSSCPIHDDCFWPPGASSLFCAIPCSPLSASFSFISAFFYHTCPSPCSLPLFIGLRHKFLLLPPRHYLPDCLSASPLPRYFSSFHFIWRSTQSTSFPSSLSSSRCLSFFCPPPPSYLPRSCE